MRLTDFPIDTLRQLARQFAGEQARVRVFGSRTHVLQLLEQHKGELARRYGVVDLALFGSTVRNAARPDSDIDILVAFDGPASSARYFGVQFYLEDLLGRPVDVVTMESFTRLTPAG